MESMDFSKLLRRKAGTIFTIVFVTVVITVGASLLFPLKYGAQSRLLVVQNTAGNDPYTISRSNEYLGNLLSQVVYSGSFYNLVLESSYNIDRGYFSGVYRDQLKTWNRTVKTRTISDTGIIEINVYHANPAQAQQIALAVNDVLINKNSLYQGGGQSVKINIIDQPLVSSYPVKPNIPRNSVIALVGSLVMAVFYIYLWPEEKYNLRLWKRKPSRKLKTAGHAIRLDYLPVEDKNQANQENNNEFRPQGNIGNILR